jgi:tRNA pseudouridine32 synthase/23S rRNA pseudouridine746 synthase
MIALFDPQPSFDELPARMPSPFATEPHPIARRAADELVRALPAGLDLDAPGAGKMFGALVVRAPDGRIGYLRAFSGMLGGAWLVDGFAPPAFDLAARDAFWPNGEAELGVLAAREADLAADPTREALAEVRVRHAAELATLRALHLDRRAARRVARASGGDDHALAQQSRGDTAERRRLDAAHAAELAPIAARVAELDAERAAIAARRADRSRELLAAIHATYALANAQGERRALRDMFDAPPGGAGDCAAPKLLAHAYRLGLAPIALAEIWVGASADRRDGACYPACRGKCGPILAHMLVGTGVESPPLFGADAIDATEPRIVFEDAWLAVVAKPAGLLSVPGRSGALRDSAATRLRARFGDAHVVHRLDLDTSGLLLVAKHPAIHAALQRDFARHAIDKRYVAILDGTPAADVGAIELPLRVDLDDRPRQLVDPVHGKAARTEWRVLSRNPTRVELVPRTGRTHQLRVHCAVGLGAPIVGDRLYGRPGERLLLHAEALAFVHPHTGERIAIEWPAPF